MTKTFEVEVRFRVKALDEADAEQIVRDLATGRLAVESPLIDSWSIIDSEAV